MTNQLWASLRASPPSSGASFDSNWTSYLKKAADREHGELHLCHVLKRLMGNPSTRDSQSGSTAEPQAERFPWITPVIGSGCAGSLSAKQEAEVAALPAKLAAACSDRDLPDGLSHSELVYDFACAMVEVRHGSMEFDPRSTSKSPISQELQTALTCVEATALLYRARHTALALVGKPVREADVIRLPSGIALQELHHSRLLPARTLLAKLSTPPGGRRPGSQVLDAYHDLFTTLHNKIPEYPQPTFGITARDLDALVEVAWQLMIAPLGIYPGWRDLMTISAFSSFQAELKADFSVLDTRQARPRFATLSGLAPELRRVRATMGTATLASPESGDRTRFFDAVAGVLKLQSDLRTARGTGPFTSAFVTSFDLELELALARAGADFTVVVPYYLAHGATGSSPEHIAPIWLATHVQSHEVVIGDDGCWARGSDNDDGHKVPGFTPRWRLANITASDDPLVVVRLVGSPLMPKALMAPPGKAGELFEDDEARRGELPDENGAIRQEDSLYIGPDVPDEIDQPLSTGLPQALRSNQNLTISTPVSLDPALVIDEYSGLHHIKSSWTSTFPNALTQADSATFRYWAGAGLQLDDSLIRLLTAAYLEPMPTEQSTSASAGAVVNRSFALPQADFLRWQGFTPVRDEYHVLTPELEHLARHLEKELGSAKTSGASFPETHQECSISFPIATVDLAEDIVGLTRDEA